MAPNVCVVSRWSLYGMGLVLLTYLAAGASGDTSVADAGWRPTPRPYCTEADGISLLALLRGHVLVHLDENVRPWPECDPYDVGTWEWELDGIDDATSPADLRPVIDGALSGRGMVGHIEVDHPAGGWRTIWRGLCSGTLWCLVDVTSAPIGSGSVNTVRVYANHMDRGVDRELSGDERAAEGIAWIEADPSGEYCAGAVAAIQGHGRARGATSVLTTQLPHESDSCNTVPLSFRFVVPQRYVTIRFWGADRPYLLQAFDAEGREVARATEHASPYEYDTTYSVSIDAGAAIVTHVTFGYERAGMAVTAVQLGVVAPAEQLVRFDAESSHPDEAH